MWHEPCQCSTVSHTCSRIQTQCTHTHDDTITWILWNTWTCIASSNNERKINIYISIVGNFSMNHVLRKRLRENLVFDLVIRIQFTWHLIFLIVLMRWAYERSEFHMKTSMFEVDLSMEDQWSERTNVRFFLEQKKNDRKLHLFRLKKSHKWLAK